MRSGVVSIVRALAHQDIAGAARLHRRVFGETMEGDPQEVSQREAYIRRVFLESADRHRGVTSLVYEKQGVILGFLGVVSREMVFQGKPIVAAMSSQFVVHPDSRSQMVGIRLLQEYFNGPQDLSIADEANDTAKKLWEGFGGATALLYSLYWTRALRPAQFAQSLVQKRKRLAPWIAGLHPLVRVLDMVAERFPGNPLRPPRTDASARSVGHERLWSYLSEFDGLHALRPEYSLAVWQWILQRAQDKRHCGTLQHMAVTDDKYEPIGWYLYYLNPGGISEVLSMAAKPRWSPVVLAHLLQHAWQGGAAAVSGRLQPEWLPLLSENRSLFHRGPWVLVQSRRPDLVQAFYQGAASLSRLEGEWCLRYQ